MAEPLEEMVNVLVALGPFAYGIEGSLTDTAREWLGHGFSPEVAHEWLATGRCFDPKAAKQLAGAGLDPDQANAKRDGVAIGYLYANGDISLAEAVTLTAPLRAQSSW